MQAQGVEDVHVATDDFRGPALEPNEPAGFRALRDVRVYRKDQA